MFVLCPHCEFLVGVDPRTGKALATCPKCGKALEPAQADPPPASATPDTAVIAAAAPPAPEPPAARPSADDVIAAMSAKVSRKPRAKSRTETEPAPKAVPRVSTRRKRTG